MEIVPTTNAPASRHQCLEPRTDRVSASEVPPYPAGHIAYVMSRFPKITETFILREMIELRRQGWAVELFALIREREIVPHPGIEEFLRTGHFGADALLRTLAANLGALLHHPLRYLRLLGTTMRHMWRSPGLLVRDLSAFPVAVYWASVAQRAGVRHIHAHFATHAAYTAYVMSRLTGIPYSFTAHAHDIYLDTSMLAEKIAQAGCVVTISDYNRRLLATLCPDAADRLHVIHCGVDTTTFRPGPRAEEREETDDNRPLRVLSVARLQEYKGIRYLVAACERLRARGVPIRCTIVGDGPERARIAKSIAQAGLEAQVSLVGWLPTPQVVDLLAQCDVFVLPSVVARDGMMEGIPTALMEAMATEVPVIATAISGTPELVISGETGLLVPEKDALALAEALAFLHQRPAERTRLGRAGRRRVEARFDLATNTARKAALFADLLK